MELGNDKHRFLIENLPEAFAYHQIVTDSEGEPVDYIFLEVNQVFEEITGLTRGDVLGRKVTEVLPGIEISNFDWIAAYGQVARTGVSTKFEAYSEPLGRWYAVTAYSDEPGYFATIFHDVTSQKREIDVVRNSEKDQKQLSHYHSVMCKASIALSEALREQEILDNIAAYLKELTGAFAASVSLYDQASEELYLIQHTFSAEQKKTIESLLGTDIFSLKFPITKIQQAEMKKKIVNKPVSVTELTWGSVSQQISDALKEQLEIEGITAVALYYYEDLLGSAVAYLGKDHLDPPDEVLSTFGYIGGLALSRHRGEKTLQKREDRFQKMLSLIPDLISIHDPDMNIIYSNWSGFGAVPEEKRVLNTKCYRTYRGFDDVCPDCQALTVLQTGEAFQKEVKLPEGIWADLRVIPILGQDGSVELFVEWVRDITERKQQEQEIIVQKKLLEGILDNIPDVVGIQNPDHSVEFYNKAGYKLLNMNPEEVKGKKCYELIGRHKECEECATSRALQSGKPEQLEKYVSELGLYLDCRSNPIFDEAGNITRVVEQLRDITEHKQFERKLLELNLAVEQSAEGFALADLDGYIRFVNKAWAEMHGYSVDELVGCHLNVFHTREQIEREVIPFNERVRKFGSNRGEVWHLHKDGTTFPTQMITTFVAETDGRPFAMLGVARDITAQKQMEKALNYRLKFEQMVSEISNKFINLPSDKMDEGINHALKLTGEFFNVDRSYVFKFSADEKFMSNTHEWRAEGVEPQMEKLQNYPLENLPWWSERIRNQDCIYIPDVDELPSEAEAEREEFQSQNIQSLLCVSLRSKNRFIGFFGFDSVKDKKTWSQETISLLKIIANVLVNAFEKHETEERIRYMSFHDNLTGLYNRRFLQEEMKRLDTERQLPISIIMVDLNGLKLVNDVYGHETGDEMLKSAAENIKKSCRKEDIVGRWGGDEFVILLPQTPVKEIEKLQRRIKDNCRDVSVKDVPVSLSLGGAIKDTKEKSLETVLKEAEDSMYKQKLAEQRSEKSLLLNALLKTLQAKSYETEEHTMRMVNMAWKIGEKIGLVDTELNRLRLVITLHDIGKINIPETILTKEGSLTDKEWEIIKTHPEVGYRITRSSEKFAHVSEDILAHHERWDGQGYPQGLKEKEIPLLARITAIVDTYDVMSYGMPYKNSRSKEEIIAEFRKCAGTQFDPELVDIFLSVLETEIK